MQQPSPSYYRVFVIFHEHHSVIMQSVPRFHQLQVGMDKRVRGPYLLVLPHSLQTAPKGECECFVGIDESVLNILAAGKHLCLDG